MGEPDVAPEPAVGEAEAAETKEAADPADSDPAAEPPVEVAEAGGPRRRPDDETLRILREEAALAAAQRKARAAGNAPAPSPEVQPEAAPPAPAAARQASPVPARPDRDEARRPETPDPDPDPDRASEPDRKEDRDAPSGSGHRPAAEGSGDLLPDLEEINSSLSGPARRPAPAARPVAETGRRRSVGTATVLGLLVLLIAIYLAAPWIGARVPALAGILGAYAAAVEALRGWIGL